MTTKKAERALKRTLGPKIRSIREGIGLTQEQLGRALGMSGASISLFECGARLPRVHIMVAMAAKLGADLSDLLEVERGAHGDQ